MGRKGSSPCSASGLSQPLSFPPPDERLHQSLERPTLNQHRGAPECSEVSWGAGGHGGGTWDPLPALWDGSREGRCAAG